MYSVAFSVDSQFGMVLLRAGSYANIIIDIKQEEPLSIPSSEE